MADPRSDESSTATLASVDRRKQRLVAVAASVLAAVSVWVVAALVLGIELWAPDFNGQEQEMAIGPVLVVATSAIAALVGWGALAALERLTDRAATVWAVGAVLAFVASLSMPFGGTNVTAANRISLAAMHVVVAIVLVPLLYRTSRDHQRADVPVRRH